MMDPTRGLKGRSPEAISSPPDGYTDLNGRTDRPDCGRGGLAHTPLAAMTVDGGERKDKLLDHRVELKLTHYAGTGARYRVTYLGQTLIESTRDPEFEACRALLAKGFTGNLVIYSPGSSVPRMRVDIAKGAQLMTIDNATDGPRIGRYRPHPKSSDRDDGE
jgi:hypothetical protein